MSLLLPSSLQSVLLTAARGVLLNPKCGTTLFCSHPSHGSHSFSKNYSLFHGPECPQSGLPIAPFELTSYHFSLLTHFRLTGVLSVFWNTLRIVSPRDLCTCCPLALSTSSPDICMAHCLTSFGSLFSYHLCIEAFLDYCNQNSNLHFSIFLLCLFFITY